MKLWRAFDIGYRYSSELLLGLVFTAGQLATQDNVGYLLMSNLYNYQAAFLFCLYLIDFTFKTFKHQDFFPKGNMYGHNRGRGMVMRAGRDICQFSLNLGGAQLFTYALASAAVGTQVGVAVGLILLKAAVDGLYDIAEECFANSTARPYELV